MRNRLALLVVTAAVIGLVLTGCGRGPGTDKMTEPSIDGTWVFIGFSAEIEVPDVTVTIGDGTYPLSEDLRFAALTQIVAKGTLTMEGTTYKLALAEGADAISVMLAPSATDAEKIAAIEIIRTLIQDAQSGSVEITVSDDKMMITVKGSFLSKVAEELGMSLPEEGLVGCKDAACTMAS